MTDQETRVQEWMSSPVWAVGPTTPVAEAYNLMMEKGVRRLPVVQRLKDGDERVIGIVTLGDLREARPSPATSLSIYELNYLLARLTVLEIMTHNPYTVALTTTMREAARIMLDRKIGGLPVVDEEGRSIGIITESDIFRMLVERWSNLTAPTVPRAAEGLTLSSTARGVVHE